MQTRLESQNRTFSEVPGNALEINSLLNPLLLHQQRRYAEIETIVGSTMVRQYPQLFTRTQQRYLTSPISVTIEENDLDQLEKEWIKPISSWDLTQRLGGRRYINYRILQQQRPVDDTTGETILQLPYRETAMGVTLPQAKLPVYVLPSRSIDTIPSIDPFLHLPPLPTERSQRAWNRYHAKVQEHHRATPEDSRSFNAEQSAAVRFARTVIHEKIHGLQDSSIPDPIAETQARYFTDKLLRVFFPNIEQDPFNTAMDFYDQLVNTHGPDVHKVLFGTAEKSVRRTLQPIIYQAFDDNMATIFPNVEWTSIAFY